MMMRRLLAALATAAALLASTVATAAAADEAQVSLDGRHWTGRISTPLFDPAFRWVPGDDDVKTFFVRNDGPSTARVTVEVDTGDPDHWIREDGLALSARVDGGAWASLRNGGQVGELVEDALRQGRQARVDVRVDFPATATDASERDRLPFSFRVTLVQAGPVGDAGQGAGGLGGLGGGLADTGTTLRMWLVWLAAGLISSGLALLAGRRRESSHG